MRMLECWKQRCGFMATYETMAKALLKINRTDLAGKVITIRQSSNAVPLLETATTNQSLPFPRESSLKSPTFPASSSGASLQAAMSSLSPATPNESTTQNVIPTLKELEEEFYHLVVFIEETLQHSEVSLDTITRRFSMLPQSVKSQHETDENYTASETQTTAYIDSSHIKCDSRSIDEPCTLPSGLIWKELEERKRKPPVLVKTQTAGLVRYLQH